MFTWLSLCLGSGCFATEWIERRRALFLMNVNAVWLGFPGSFGSVLVTTAGGGST